MNKRDWLLASAATSAWLWAPASLRAQTPPVQGVAVVSLLGNSVRVVAKQMQEVMFKDVAMDDVVLAAAQQALRGRLPQAQLLPFTAPEQVNVDDQLKIGTAASRDGELPDWVVLAAQKAALGHVLLIGCGTGVMEFRTGMTQVVGNNRVTGVGFYVSADGRTKNVTTGAVSSGYLAPFVQLRLTLVEAKPRRVLRSTPVGEGFIVGPPEPEAPDPWQFMKRADKAQALRQLLNTTVTRGVESLLS